MFLTLELNRPKRIAPISFLLLSILSIFGEPQVGHLGIYLSLSKFLFVSIKSFFKLFILKAIQTKFISNVKKTETSISTSTNNALSFQLLKAFSSFQNKIESIINTITAQTSEYNSCLCFNNSHFLSPYICHLIVFFMHDIQYIASSSI